MTGLMTGLTMTNERWMTYDDLAAALGIAPDSARRLVARKKWSRRPGNDGKARISVPADALPDVASVITPDVTPVIRPDVIPDALQVLTRHIERLEAELSLMRAERDKAGELALQLAALTATLEAVSAERDRWHATATAPRGWFGFRRAS
jgi:uncharacterized small protein (DUF1192 family)